MPNETPTDTEKEVQRYMRSIADQDSWRFATARFVSGTDQLLSRAAKGLTTAAAGYDQALMPAQILLSGFAMLNKDVEPLQQGWKVASQIGRCVILTCAAGPLGAVVGGTQVLLSVLVLLDEAETRAAEKREKELIASMAQKLEDIRARVATRVAKAKARDQLLATDADDADDKMVYVTVRGMKYTETSRVRLRRFFQDTLSDIKDPGKWPLDIDKEPLDQLLTALQTNKPTTLNHVDLAMISFMGDSLFDLDPRDARARKMMRDFADQAFASVREILQASGDDTGTDKDRASALPGYVPGTRRGA